MKRDIQDEREEGEGQGKGERVGEGWRLEGTIAVWVHVILLLDRSGSQGKEKLFELQIIVYPFNKSSTRDLYHRFAENRREFEDCLLISLPRLVLLPPSSKHESKQHHRSTSKDKKSMIRNPRDPTTQSTRYQSDKEEPKSTTTTTTDR